VSVSVIICCYIWQRQYSVRHHRCSIKETDFMKLLTTGMPEWPAIIMVYSAVDSYRILKLNVLKHALYLKMCVDQKWHQFVVILFQCDATQQSVIRKASNNSCINTGIHLFTTTAWKLIFHEMNFYLYLLCTVQLDWWSGVFQLPLRWGEKHKLKF
jgi:hypothetical protein